jgi:superfamily II DNA or RNA helicase
VTYQTVAAEPAAHGRAGLRARTLLIADEPHHMGEHAAWGRRMQAAFGPATFRLLLSGTPFRSDSTPIPWVTYGDDGVSRADFTYTYTAALLDGVCRPVTFQPYDGDMEWVSDGRRRRADFAVALPATDAARRLRTALDPDGDWMGRVLGDAHARLVELRAGDHPDAGGLVVAVDKEHAERLAARLGRITGEAPVVVTSDAPDASARIARFAGGRGSWLVSVLMVSEGVDIPRLRVGVYATAARTELFFRQVVGRFIRRTLAPREQMSYLFLPSDPRLKRLAVEVEEERNHALDFAAQEDAEAVERADAVRVATGFEALWSSARPDEDVLCTTQPGEALQLFAEPGGAPAPAATSQPAPPAPEPVAPHERRERLRAERQALVAAEARRSGEPHSAIHARVNRATGSPSVARATADQLERGNRLLEREAARR